MSNSRETWVIGLPLVYASRTAFALKSGSVFFLHALFLLREEYIRRFLSSTQVVKAQNRENWRAVCHESGTYGSEGGRKKRTKQLEPRWQPTLL